MKIRKVYVSSFGKLKDFSLEFKDGFNEINEKNGWGKTTLATFIKSIFYGLDNGRKALSGSDRKKYKPWNSTEKFGGYVEFCWGNNEYKIERYFGEKESDDTVKLFDLKTGKESFQTENLGKRLFSIDEEGFSSSVYFSQKDLEGDVSTGLIEKFNSSYSKENDNFDKAFSRVDQTLKEYKIRGDKGKIPQIKQRIFDLSEEVNVAKKARETYNAVENEVKVLKEKCETLKKTIDDLAEKIERAGSAEAIKVKKERVNAYEKRLQELNDELKSKTAFFKNGVPTDTEFEGYYNCYKELKTVKEEIVALVSAVNLLKTSGVSCSQNGNNNKIVSISCFVLAAIFAVLGGIFVSKSTVVGIIFFVFFAAALSFGLAFTLKKRSSINKKEAENTLLSKEERLSEYKKIAAIYESKLNAFFDGFDFDKNEISDYYDGFSAIKVAMADITRINAYIVEEEKQYANLRLDKDVFSENAVSDSVDINDLKYRAANLRNEYAVKERELAEKISDLKKIDETASKLPDLENALSGMKDELNKAEEEFIILSKTKEFLAQANDHIIGKYRAPMEESFKKYLSLIDKDKDYGGIIDVDLNLTIKDGERTYDPVYYSEGYRNLFEICKRFAFIDVLFTGEKPFIVLDDPFSNLDDEKVKAGIDLLNKISSEYQIIYFICHNARSSSVE